MICCNEAPSKSLKNCTNPTAAIEPHKISKTKNKQKSQQQQQPFRSLGHETLVSLSQETQQASSLSLSLSLSLTLHLGSGLPVPRLSSEEEEEALTNLFIQISLQRVYRKPNLYFPSKSFIQLDPQC
jgi:hypothetical protein